MGDSAELSLGGGVIQKDTISIVLLRDERKGTDGEVLAEDIRALNASSSPALSHLSRARLSRGVPWGQSDDVPCRVVR